MAHSFSSQKAQLNKCHKHFMHGIKTKYFCSNLKVRMERSEEMLENINPFVQEHSIMNFPRFLHFKIILYLFNCHALERLRNKVTITEAKREMGI